MNYASLFEKVQRGHTLSQTRGVGILRSDVFARTHGIEHGFSTRLGGISPQPYASMNLSLTRDDSRENVLRNYRIFFDAAGLDIGRAVLVNHEHGSNIVRVDSSNAGQGLFKEPLPFCDGLITNDPAAILVTLHADCGCCYLFDPVNRAIGLAHAGWKGTYRRVAESLAKSMAREFSSRPDKMLAALGPCICKECFEVDEGIADDFVSEFQYESLKKPGKPGKAYVNLESALILQLCSAGIPPENISSMGLCTYERSDLLYSYRRDKGMTGAMIGYLLLTP